MNTNRGTARIGALVPYTNRNLEPDLALLAPLGVSIHIARIGGYDADAVPDDAQMRGLGEADIDTALQLLAGVEPEVVLYGCTSATLSHGPAFDRALATRLSSLCGAGTVTAAGALVACLRTLALDKVGFASPYVPAINTAAIDFLTLNGIEVLSTGAVDTALDNTGQGALSPAEVLELGRRADHPDAKAIVLSCTDMRALEAIDALEQETGKLVISSNQAMMLQALTQLGLKPAYAGLGRLLAGEWEPNHV